MMSEPVYTEKFEDCEEFGTVQISADTLGFHIREQEKGNQDQKVWMDAEEAEQVKKFIEQWLPQVQTARPPKCPNCYAKYEQMPERDPHDAEMTPIARGDASQWHCVFCSKTYISDPFGKFLSELKPPSEIEDTPSPDEHFDPFLD